jgi:hypothetical protein
LLKSINFLVSTRLPALDSNTARELRTQEGKQATLPEWNTTRKSILPAIFQTMMIREQPSVSPANFKGFSRFEDIPEAEAPTVALLGPQPPAFL